MLNPFPFKTHSSHAGARTLETDRPAKAAHSASRRPFIFLALAAVMALALTLAACGTGAATQATAATSAATQAGAATTGSSASMPAITTAPAGMTSAATTAGQAGTSGGIINVKIDASKAREMLKSNPNAILLDVRTVEENREKRIPGSTLIPIQELPNRLGELPKDPNRPILVYCRSGNRSAQAAAILSKAGFPAVYDFGGIIDWPYETEQG